MVSEVYQFLLEKSEPALNIVLGSALGAYIGVALSLSPEKIDTVGFAIFLALTFFFVRSLLSLQFYAREKTWQMFFLVGGGSVLLLALAHSTSTSLPMNSSVFGVIGALWLGSVFFDTAQCLIIERIVLRKKIQGTKKND